MSLFSTFTHEGPLPPLQVPGGGRRALAANAECGFWRGVIRFVENTQVAQANEHRTRFGMPRLSGDVDDFYRRLPLILLTGLPGFVEGPTPANVCCVGPCRWREPVSEKTAARVRALVGAGSEPLVCVSLTSVHAHGRLRESFLRVCIAALAELPVRAVVLTGGLPIEDTPAPAHVVIERWLPHRLLFPHVSALVTNGGAGTVGAGLADGVPMVVAPVHSDQPENAWRVECNGLGLRLSSRATVEELRAAARRVLSDATILNNVTATSARIQRLEGAARAAKLLEDCADSAAAVRSTSSRRPGGLRAIT